MSSKLLLSKQQDSENVGSCTTFCSTQEKTFRIREGLVHPLEQRNGEPDCLIKEFVRSAAGKASRKSCDLRTPDTLKTVTDYLMDSVCQRTDVNWAIIFTFTFDRLRAIRQDMVIQSVKGDTAIYILERAILFYLKSITMLKSESIHLFDPKINSAHLQECLKQLLVHYSEQRLAANENEPMDDIICRQVEFESYYILVNAGHQDALNHFLSLPLTIRKSADVEAVWFLNLAILEGNYIRAFRILKEFNEFKLAAVHYHLPMWHTLFLRRMNTAFSSKNCCYPLSELVENVFLKEGALLNLINSHGITVDNGFVKFYKLSWT